MNKENTSISFFSYKIFRSDRGNILVIPNKENSPFQKHIILLNTNFNELFEKVIEDLRIHQLDNIITIEENQLHIRSTRLEEEVFLKIEVVKELDKVILANLVSLKFEIKDNFKEEKKPEIPVNFIPIFETNQYSFFKQSINYDCMYLYGKRIAHIEVFPKTIESQYIDRNITRELVEKVTTNYKIEERKTDNPLQSDKLITSILKNKGEATFIIFNMNKFFSIRIGSGKLLDFSIISFEIEESKLLELSTQFLISFPIFLSRIQYFHLGQLGMPTLFGEYIIYAGGKKFLRKSNFKRSTRLISLRQCSLKDELGFFIRDLNNHKAIFKDILQISSYGDLAGTLSNFKRNILNLSIIQKRKIEINTENIDFLWLYQKKPKTYNKLLSLKSLQNNLYDYGYPIMRAIAWKKDHFKPKIAGLKMTGDRIFVEVSTNFPMGYSATIKNMKRYAIRKIKELIGKKRFSKKMLLQNNIPDTLKKWVNNEFWSEALKNLYCDQLLSYSFLSKIKKIRVINQHCMDLLPLVKPVFEKYRDDSSNEVKEFIYQFLTEHITEKTQNIILIFFAYLQKISERSTEKSFLNLINQTKAVIYALLRSMALHQNPIDDVMVIKNILPVIRASINYMLKVRGYHLNRGIVFRGKTAEELQEITYRGLGFEMGRMTIVGEEINQEYLKELKNEINIEIERLIAI